MSSQSTMKKRKRAQQGEASALVPVGERVTISLSGQPASEVGPVLASFPALLPSSNIAFQLYEERNSAAGSDDFASRSGSLHMAGEDDSMEFFTSDETQKAAALGSRYVVGIYSKQDKKVIMRSAPLQVVARQVKATKKLKAKPQPLSQWLQARNELGEAFGTKKAQTAIRAAERNKMDVSAMEGVTEHLQNTIEKNTSTLPSIEEAKAAADEVRLIPRYNTNATTPDQVYALSDIIPEPELAAIPISEPVVTLKDCQTRLPYKHSTWVNNHLHYAFEASKPNKMSLKKIWFIAAMLAFHSASRKLGQNTFKERMQNIPTIIADGFMSRFTETARGATQAQVTTANQTNLLTHIFALCLHVDDFATDTAVLASDLSMSVNSVNSLFKSLGCKIEKLSQADLSRLGLPSSAAEAKYAVLRVPLEFPRARVKRRN